MRKSGGASEREGKKKQQHSFRENTVSLAVFFFVWEIEVSSSSSSLKVKLLLLLLLRATTQNFPVQTPRMNGSLVSLTVPCGVVVAAAAAAGRKFGIGVAGRQICSAVTQSMGGKEGNHLGNLTRPNQQGCDARWELSINIHLAYVLVHVGYRILRSVSNY